MAQDIEADAKAFAKRYAALFSSRACSDKEHVAEVASSVAKHYRPGATIFTNGTISRFETQQEAASLIEREMRKNIDYGIGTHLELLAISKMEVYSQTSALCWLDWAFHPRSGSEYEGRGWQFTNIYGYRAATTEGVEAGWEFVVRDEEVNAMVRATGKRFDD